MPFAVIPRVIEKSCFLLISVISQILSSTLTSLTKVFCFYRNKQSHPWPLVSLYFTIMPFWWIMKGPLMFCFTNWMEWVLHQISTMTISDETNGSLCLPGEVCLRGGLLPNSQRELVCLFQKTQLQFLSLDCNWSKVWQLISSLYPQGNAETDCFWYIAFSNLLLAHQRPYSEIILTHLPLSMNHWCFPISFLGKPKGQTNLPNQRHGKKEGKSKWQTG